LKLAVNNLGIFFQKNSTAVASVYEPIKMEQNVEEQDNRRSPAATSPSLPGTSLLPHTTTTTDNPVLTLSGGNLAMSEELCLIREQLIV
jgi:ABC-type phosphate transport system ATPase subunit